MNRKNLSKHVIACLKRLPEPFANHYGVVPPPPPQSGIRLGKVGRRVQSAMAAIAEADQSGRKHDRILVRQEAVSSSAIEGIHSTLDDLQAIEEGRPADREEVVQVCDYALALERLLPRAIECGDGVFTLDLIRELHLAVMKSDAAYRKHSVPGEIRDSVVWIGGRGRIEQSTYNPAPPEDVPACLADCLTYMRNEGMQAMTQTIVERIAIAHAHFEAVHPMSDGNGRVGRMLISLMMSASGHAPLFLSPYIEANVDRYVEALKSAQQRLEWAEIVGFMADAITDTVGRLPIYGSSNPDR